MMAFTWINSVLHAMLHWSAQYVRHYCYWNQRLLLWHLHSIKISRQSPKPQWFFLINRWSHKKNATSQNKQSWSRDAIMKNYAYQWNALENVVGEFKSFRTFSATYGSKDAPTSVSPVPSHWINKLTQCQSRYGKNAMRESGNWH